MTLINFVKKTELPTKNELENKIRELGYDFRFLTEFERLDNLNNAESLDCELNGAKTYLEIYLNPATEILSDFPNLKKDLSDKDLGISFTFGSEELVSACINIISIGLIDLSKSIVLYTDDEVIYSRKMLIQETSDFLDYIENEAYSIPKEALEENEKYNRNKKIKNLIKIIVWVLFSVGIILMQRKITSWIIPSILLAYILVESVIDHNKKRRFKN